MGWFLYHNGPRHETVKKVLWEISQNSGENICVGISLFDKVKLRRSAAS